MGLAEILSRAFRPARILTATDGRDTLLNSPDGWEVDTPGLWWLGPAGGNGTGGPWGNPLPNDGRGREGLAVTIPGVTRATSLIVDTIAGLPWQVTRDTATITAPTWITDPQGLRVDARTMDPAALIDTRLSAVEFWADWIRAALWHGDGYVYVPVRNVDGSPRPPIWQLHPHKVTIAGGKYWVGETNIPATSLMHLRGNGPYRDGHGRGVIDDHTADLRLASSIRAYEQNVFHSGVPYGYLKVTGPNPTQKQIDDLKAKWYAQHGARRDIAILNATTDFNPISFSPIDAALDTARTWSLRDIALAFGLPPYMLGVAGDSQTYANVESRMIEFDRFTLLQWIRRIESTLDAQFPMGTELKIRTAGMMRADTLTRYQAYAVALSNGILTRDEVRRLEDYPPIDGPLLAPGPDDVEDVPVPEELPA